MNQNQADKYWLALAHAPCNIGSNHVIHLLNYFGNLGNVFEANRRELQALHLERQLLLYLQNPNWYAVEGDMRWLAERDHYLLSLDHPNYPWRLREIYHPPLVLFVRGDYTLLNSIQLAIVGTRCASDEGMQTAQTFAKQLSHQGLTITSGMLYGIEGASHVGALAGTGKTIAVLGWGLDQIYPPAHRELGDKIAETGALVSEFPPGTPVKHEHFLRRSRIISGLSLGTLVIEAAKYSYSLKTIYFALEQGREVFAVPGSIYNPLTKGCHQLIKQGAKLVETTEDILDELKIYLNG
ncbi:SMF protein [Beggiatoa sp. PS]|nr:SMF protein [Beggiatoa sp. PS]